MEFYQANRIPMRLDMAPLIDVVFLLLVFFMLTSSMATPQAIEMNLPKSSQGISKSLTEITVSVNPSGEVFLNKEQTKVSALASKIEALISAGAPSEVSLEVDYNVSVQQMITVMDELKKAGGGNISLSTAGANDAAL